MSQKDQTMDHEIILRDPQSVLQKRLGKDMKVVDFKTESFLKVGDNYGSTILQVKAIIKRRNQDEEGTLNLIAKMLPPTEAQRLIFQSDFTFKKEIFIYEDLLPTYAQLYGGDLDIAPKFYGSRLSIEPDADHVENDAVILMENLKDAGYFMEDRHKGMNPEQVKVALLSLAKFHAIGLSVKHKMPSYLPTLQKHMKPMTLLNEIMKPYITTALEHIKNDEFLSQYFDRIKRTKDFENLCDSYFHVLDVEDKWACPVHSDLWINNILFHRDEVGNYDNTKFVDFQICYISSPLTDLIFFLCTSMKRVPEDLDEMLEFYRENVIRILKELKCDVNIFAKEDFNERLKIDAINQLYHIFLMIKVVELRENEDVQDSPMNEYCLIKLRKVVQMYVDRNWI